MNVLFSCVLSTLLVVVIGQLKLEVSSEDIIEIPSSTEFNSQKLEFLRKRRRKLMTSTVSPALKVLPKEPRITVLSKFS